MSQNKNRRQAQKAARSTTPSHDLWHLQAKATVKGRKSKQTLRTVRRTEEETFIFCLNY